MSNNGLIEAFFRGIRSGADLSAARIVEYWIQVDRYGTLRQLGDA